MTTPIRNPNDPSYQYYLYYQQYWGQPAEAQQPLPDPPSDVPPDAPPDVPADPPPAAPPPSVTPPPSTTPPPPDPSAQVAADRAQFEQACNTLKQHWGDMNADWFGNGSFDMNSLHAAARGDMGPDVQQAAQFLLSHPSMLDELDTAQNGGSTDGRISMGDLDSQLHSLSQEDQLKQLQVDGRLGDMQRSVQTMLDNKEKFDAAGDIFGGTDGRICREDLVAVLNGSQYSPELKDAAAFFLRNQDLLGMLDTAAKGGGQDGTVSWDDLAALNRQLKNAQSELPAPIKPYRPIAV